jgi:hypothetical protein
MWLRNGFGAVAPPPSFIVASAAPRHTGAENKTHRRETA